MLHQQKQHLSNVKVLFTTRLLKPLLLLLYSATFVVMCRYTIKHSEFDLDILFYSACAMDEHYTDKIELHKAVYQKAFIELGAKKYLTYTDSTKQIRNNYFKDPTRFIDMLPYYQVKTFYVFLLKLGFQRGYSPFIFSVYINIFCYLIVSLLFFDILRRKLGFIQGILISYLVLLSPAFTSTLISNTPDLLSASLLLSGIYCLLRNTLALAYLSLLCFVLLVLTRTENVLFVMIFSGCVMIYKVKHLPPYYFLLLVLLCVGVYFLNSNSMGFSSWKNLYKLTNLPPEDITSPLGELTLKEYLLGFRRIPNNIFYCDVSLIVLFSIVPILNKNPSEKTQLIYLLVWTNLLFLIARILLLPDITNRYFCGSFLVSVICFFYLGNGMLKPKVQNHSASSLDR